MIETPSPNFNDRPRDTPIDMLVVHYTGMESAGAALERLCDPTFEVSAHYLIDEDGTLHRLVREAHRAWHAGVAAWRGHTDINGRSIGVELVNPGHEFGYRPFPIAQMAAFRDLAKSILGRHPIPARNVVGHSDVAPSRKTDPGELFDWQGLAADGIGFWPPPLTASAMTETEAAQILNRYGYENSDPAAAVTAFQRHFHTDIIDGVVDEVTASRILALADAV